MPASRIMKPATVVVTALCVLVQTLLFSTPAHADILNSLPLPGMMVRPSDPFVPVLLRGMTLHPEDPMRFDFIVDSGETGADGGAVRDEAEKAVRYFMAALTVPEDDLWVNLSPYEGERIIPDELSRTELGRDLLAQDYLLKQITASLMYPEDDLGAEFWERVYARAAKELGRTDIPVDTFNKVWIMPESASVYEHGGTVYITGAKLKVMLEEDYLASLDSEKLKGKREKGENVGTMHASSVSLPGDNSSASSTTMAREVVRETILPAIEREVNEGRHFAALRQIYYSLILAQWYKEIIKNGLFSQIYSEQSKIVGVESEDKSIKEQIYSQYIEAYKKGVFNYIKADYDQLNNKIIPRKYFSGGAEFNEIPLSKPPSINRHDLYVEGKAFNLKMGLKAWSRADSIEHAKYRKKISEAGYPDKEIPEIISILSRMGFNIDRFPMKTKMDFRKLYRLYRSAKRSGMNGARELTDEDIEFFKYYSLLFNDEYYRAATMSGYLDYIDVENGGVDTMSELTLKRAEAMVDNLQMKEGESILDVGAAAGYYVQAFRQLGYDAEGVDISEFIVGHSDENFREFLHLLDGPDFREKLKKRRYDVILFKDVLEHVPEALVPRFWNTFSQLGRRALVIVPVTDGQGVYINEVDEQDFTHFVRRNKNWWLNLFGHEYSLADRSNVVVKEGKAVGTLTVIVDMERPAIKDSNRNQNYVVEENKYFRELVVIDLADSDAVMKVAEEIINKHRNDPLKMFTLVKSFLLQYRDTLKDDFGRDETSLADYLYYKVLYGFFDRVRSEFQGKEQVGRIFAAIFSELGRVDQNDENDIVRIALIGTAMVRAEPIKKDEYFKGKIQRKFLSPPFGVYRLEKYLYDRYKDEIAQGRIRIDILDPALVYVAKEESLDELFHKIRTGNYDFIGFSPIRILLGEDLLFMNKVHEITKDAPKKPLYFAGGNEASMNPGVLFDAVPWLDYSVSGLGEPVLQQMIDIEMAVRADQKVSEPEDFKDIPGLMYYLNGELVRNPFERLTVEEFIAFANYYGENIPYDRYWRHNYTLGPVDTNFEGTNIEVVRIFTRNFCPYNCPFCSVTVFGKQVYKGGGDSLTAKHIGHMIKRAYEVKKAKGVYFNDDEMFGNKQNAIDILNEIVVMKKSGVIPEDMRFYGQTRVDMVDEKILRLVKDAGFLFLSYGVESFSDKSLKSPDLRKSFSAEQAYESVLMALKAGVPITNINLILFHPSAERNDFITTVERTVGLLRESIAAGVRLSVNSFPLIEAYPGSPVNRTADEFQWPRTKGVADTGNGEVEFVLSYLPIAEDMRYVVEDDRLMTEFEKIMSRLVQDDRWPTATVSRNIGVNGLVMFMAAYTLMGIDERESQVTIENMEELIWKLVEMFNPSIDRATNILSAQNANIVFTKRYGKPLFRRSGMEIEDIPKEIIAKFDEKLDGEILISLQDVGLFALRQSLHEIYYTDISVEDAFVKHGVKFRKNFKKVLLIAPLGNYDGTPLKTSVPHIGLEQINHNIIRNESNWDVDSRVFNPNLVGKERLKEVLQEESFDVIAFSFLNMTLKNDASLIDDAAVYAPNALRVAGGINIAMLDYKEIFGAVPFDALLIGPGEVVLSRVLNHISQEAGVSKEDNLRNLQDIPNLVVKTGGKIVETGRERFVYNTSGENEVKEDVPYDRPDLTHGTSYSQKSEADSSNILPYDMIGTRRLYVKVSDRCRARCIFCSAPKERIRPAGLDEVIQTMLDNLGSYDSIHFSDNDLLVDRDLAIQLSYKIIEAGLEDIPKVGKAKTDEVDPELLGILKRAGFEIITYGIETFDDRILDKMRKQTTAEINREALSMTIEAGLRPGMDMIFFSPWETFETLLASLKDAVSFLEQGAYLSVVPHMAIQMGDITSRMSEVHVEYEEIHFESTGKTLRNPLKARLNDDIEDFRKKVLDRRIALKEELREKLRNVNNGYISFSVEGLLFARAAYEMFVEEGIYAPEEIDYGNVTDKVERLIQRTIDSEIKRFRGLPSELPPPGGMISSTSVGGEALQAAGSPTASDEDIGGIDMTAIGVDRSGAGVDGNYLPALPPFDGPTSLDTDPDGFIPVFLNFTPLESILPLLGLSEDGPPHEAARSSSTAELSLAR